MERQDGMFSLIQSEHILVDWIPQFLPLLSVSHSRTHLVLSHDNHMTIAGASGLLMHRRPHIHIHRIFTFAECHDSCVWTPPTTRPGLATP